MRGLSFRSLRCALVVLQLLLAAKGYAQPAQDKDDPIKPELVNVSVLESGEVEIKWTVEQPELIEAFDILLWIYPDVSNPEGGFQPVERVPNDGNFSFLHYPNQACEERAIYSVRPETEEPSLQSDDMQTILLHEQIAYGTCAHTAKLSWSAFNMDTDETEYYQIWVEENGMDFIMIDEISPSALSLDSLESTWGNQSTSTTNIYSYTHTGLTPGSTYRYYVAAIHNGFESRSCIRELKADDYGIPAFYRLHAVSVNAESNIELLTETDLSVTLDGVDFLKSDDPAALMEAGGFSLPTSNWFTYIDTAVNPAATPYYYQYRVHDSCGQVLQAVNNMHRSIHLRGEASADSENHLYWNTYEGWEVASYRVFRKLDGDAGFTEIATLPPASQNYTDDLTAYPDQMATVGYYIEAVAMEQSETNIPIEELVSRSNRISLSRERDPIMPNAFNPKGINNMFGPAVAFYGEARPYLLQIYNRWGQLLFESGDANQGWDGSYNGRLVQPGVYVYLLNYEDVSGQSQSIRGTVTVVY